MQTITIDIINKKAIKLLRDFELLQLIRLRREDRVARESAIDWTAKYKGAMTKQKPVDIDHQLNELRNEWE